jgi:uncharacterized protein
MALNLKNAVSEYLKLNLEQKFTAREIAMAILKLYPKECQAKKERSKATVVHIVSDADLLQQIVAEIGSIRPLLQKKIPQIKTTEGRPRKYYFSEKSDDTEIEIEEANEKRQELTEQAYWEHDLYPKLIEFLWRELNVFCNRIDEKRSKNSHGTGGNRWLFPDIVGLEDLSNEWRSEIKECVRLIADKKTKIWSFEVKKIINRSNVREAYFQAVSNSTWANFGYLAAAEIQGVETLKELRMLSGLHGIGLIEIDVDSPADSQIMIPARERIDIDWNAANRLAEENSHFMECIDLICQFYQTGKHRPKDWDSHPFME